MDVNIQRTNGASEKEIIDAELRLSCRLPRGYREFVSNHNGAKPSSNTFAVPGNESSVRRFVPIEDAASVRQAIEGFPIEGVPVAEDDCGNYVWLEPKTGAVFFWDHNLTSPECVSLMASTTLSPS